MDALEASLRSALDVQVLMSQLPPTRTVILLQERWTNHVNALRAGVRLAYGDDDDRQPSAGRPQ